MVSLVGDSIFRINLPTGILSLLICYKILDRGESKEIKWDIIGTISQFLALFSLVYLLNYITANPIDVEALIILTFTVSTTIIFIWWERRRQYLISNLSILRNISFFLYNLSLHLNYVCMYIIIFVMPFYLLKVLPITVYNCIVLTAAPLSMMFLAPISGIISDKFGSRPLSFIGALICALAFYTMTQLQFYSSEIDVFLRLALLGVGEQFSNHQPTEQ